MVHPGGAPRTVSLEPEEMIKLGEEMIAWIQENDPLHVSEWYCLEKSILESEWETMIKRSEFVGYYEKAKKLIGRKYLDKTSNVRDGISHRWQSVYFRDLKKEEKEEKEEEHKRKKELIDYQASKLNDKIVSPYQSDIDLRHENMILKDEIRRLKESNADKS